MAPNANWVINCIEKADKSVSRRMGDMNKSQIMIMILIRIIMWTPSSPSDFSYESRFCKRHDKLIIRVFKTPFFFFFFFLEVGSPKKKKLEIYVFSWFANWNCRMCKSVYRIVLLAFLHLNCLASKKKNEETNWLFWKCIYFVVPPNGYVCRLIKHLLWWPFPRYLDRNM